MNAHGQHRYICRQKRTNPALDWMVRLAIVGGPVMTLPQIYTIWATKNTGVSISTWAAYMVVNSIWYVYAVKHHERQLAIAQVVWIILDTAIVIGLLKSMMLK